MLSQNLKKIYNNILTEFEQNNTYKKERIITTKQGRFIDTINQNKIINFCANNYLGFGGDQKIINYAKEGLDKYGYGLNSVRFICGTQNIHKDLEKKISNFLHTEDTILYSSAFDANGGLFETILSKEDVIISDSLNHASIIDGIRLCKAEKKIFTHLNMEDLENKLIESKNARIKLIATDGIFSMDGDIAPLDKIVTLGKKYDAMIMIDDSHSIGVVGKTGRGTSEYFDLLGKVDIITGTFGKALGGASGGFTSGKKEIIEILRQKSRPYLFSNSLAPTIVYTEIKILSELENDDTRIKKLQENTKYFREKISSSGFKINNFSHPIIPIMIDDDSKVTNIANDLLKKGIYVVGFCFPVVPKNTGRIRIQLSSIHTKEDIDYFIECLNEIIK